MPEISLKADVFLRIWLWQLVPYVQGGQNTKTKVILYRWQADRCNISAQETQYGFKGDILKLQKCL